MIVGVEYDFVVHDSIQALELYEQIFDVKRVHVTNFFRGENEVIFTLYGVRFHMLDENPQFHLHAPKPGHVQSSWINVTVPDIRKTYEKALELGCKEVQPITEYPEMYMANAIFSDPFGYVWMLHEIKQEMTKEEFEEQLNEIWETYFDQEKEK